MVIGTALLAFVLIVRPGVEGIPLAINTLSSAFAGVVGAMLVLKLLGMPANTSTNCTGLLAGLVAIAGSCDLVAPVGAVVIGGVAGALCVVSTLFWERMGVDDAIGAISVFGSSGIWGVVAVGLFACGRYGAGWNGVMRPAFAEKYGIDGVRGLFYGDPSQLAVQLLAAGVLIPFGLIMAFAWIRLSKWAMPTRSGAQGE